MKIILKRTPPPSTNTKILVLLGIAILSSCLLKVELVSGFHQNSPIVGSPRITASDRNNYNTISSLRGERTQLFAGPIKIDEWEILKSGAVRGTVSNHPDLPDGYEITTSPLETNPSKIKNNVMVTTLSGSKYKLLKGLPPKGEKATAPPNRSTVSIFGASAKPSTQKESKPAARNATTPKAKSPAKAKPAVSFKAPAPVKKPAPAPKATPKAIDYNLNGKVVGGLKENQYYLLVGNLIKSSSRRSQIYYAYEADSDGQPKGNRLTVKLQNSAERLSRESDNYDRVFSKGRVAFSLEGSGSCFVRKVAFVPNADESPFTKGIPRGSSALILESGDENLRTYATESGGGLSGGSLRRAAVNVCRCVEAMHSSGLVWTDLKAENFVLTQGGKEVKGIDLESAVPIRSAPEDYSPEACPPEFAAAEKAGLGYDFECLKNYDAWSLGMLLFELATGKNYFKGKAESAMTNELASQAIIDPATGIAKGLEAIEDDNFRDLVSQCLNVNPSKRPSITQILLHPYFLTTGLGPITF